MVIRLLYYLPMERMNKGDLLQTGTAYMEVHTFEGVDYITVKDFNKAINHLQIEIGGLMGERDGLQMVIERLHKEIAEQEAEGLGLFDEIEYRKRECKKLKEELKKHKKLHKYSNGELQTYSGD